MPDLVQPELVIAELERIVSNPPLESSPSLCRLLRYVVEETLAGNAASLKEYSLGVTVFERGDNFDPRLDPIVRVQARNLRVRLAQYYSGPGAADPILIDLPKRTYVPVFSTRAAEPEPEPQIEAPPPEIPVAVPSAPAQPRRSAPAVPRARTMAVGVIAVLIVLSAAAVLLWKQQRAHSAYRPVHEPDPVAQDLYIRGRYMMDRLTESALRDSIDSFQRAIARDSQFAAAYAGMADAYDILSQHGYIPPGEGMEQARRAAQQALATDPNLAEAHVALAGVLEAYDWNWSEAEREYRRALTLNPQLPAAHLWYGSFLRDQGRLGEALPELRLAAQLDPFSLLTSINLAHAYLEAGNYDGAVEQALHATQLAPQLVSAQMILAHAYRAQRKTGEADAVLTRAGQVADDNPHAVAMLANDYARHGKREQGAALLHHLEDIARHRYVSPFDMATVSLGLGDEKRALDLLEEAYRQRSSGLIFLRNANFGEIRNSPEFHSLVEKMHFAG